MYKLIVGFCLFAGSFLFALGEGSQNEALLFATAPICFIACHGGPADHFSVFASELSKKGFKVEVFGTGPALKKFQDRNIEWVKPFSLEKGTEEEIASELVKRCSNASVVITDVGHTFDIAMQKALSSRAPSILRVAYYDNPESYVPGGYSDVASLVIGAAQRVLFANSNLAKTPHQSVGIGYYPLEQAAKIAERRLVEKTSLRSQFFSKCGMEDRGQKVLVYTGGNNEEYFSKAFPAFLQMAEQIDCKEYVVVLQQHPGAKEKNRDVNTMHEWQERHPNGKMIVSDFSSEDAQVMADAILYYQTSMGPQFVLSGIPTIQVGHEVFKDILVVNGLCSSATNGPDFIKALNEIKSQRSLDKNVIKKGLGLLPDWQERLIQGLSNEG